MTRVPTATNLAIRADKDSSSIKISSMGTKIWIPPLTCGASPRSCSPKLQSDSSDTGTVELSYAAAIREESYTYPY